MTNWNSAKSSTPKHKHEEPTVGLRLDLTAVQYVDCIDCRRARSSPRRQRVSCFECICDGVINLCGNALLARFVEVLAKSFYKVFDVFLEKGKASRSCAQIVKPSLEALGTSSITPIQRKHQLKNTSIK
jgi:hypothetical protein